MENALKNSVEDMIRRQRRVAEGAEPTPSRQVMARDAADLLQALLDQAEGEPKAPVKEESDGGGSQGDKPAPKPRRRAAPKAEG